MMTKKEFWEKIYEGTVNDKEKLIQLLELRGFLLNDEKTGLSNNALFKDDLSYMQKLFQEYEIGEVYPSGYIKIYNAQDYPLIQEKAFAALKIGTPSVFNYYGWDYFAHRYHGYKAPVESLEPFIARYVKAISSAGVITVGCCDGSHEESIYALLQFDDPASPIWHEQINNLLKDYDLDSEWTSETHLYFKNGDKYETYYRLNRAAAFIYKNRQTLREIKKDALSRIPTKDLKRKEHKELKNIFIENIKTLIMKYQFISI